MKSNAIPLTAEGQNGYHGDYRAINNANYGKTTGVLTKEVILSHLSSEGNKEQLDKFVTLK